MLRLQKIFAITILLVLIFFPGTTKAVLPPDFIFNIGSQVLQFFSAIIIFCSGIFVFLYQFIKAKTAFFRHKKTYLTLTVITIVGIAGAASYILAAEKQKIEYENWQKESQKYAEKFPENNTVEVVTSTPLLTSSSTTKEKFFEIHQNNPLFVTNDEFEHLLKTNTTTVFVLDAREDIEYEIGHFPKSTHIRFADLKAGDFEKLPKDTFIYVFCWSGIRGKEVAQFLRTKGIIGIYLENGANSWYQSGGTWEGDIKFTQKYDQLRFQKVFETKEVKELIKNGAFLVDSREPTKFKNSHIPGSKNISMLSTPTSELEASFAQVPAKSKVITMCDEYVNCFDAKVTGVELEKRGYEFLGRYNKPWDYGNE